MNKLKVELFDAVTGEKQREVESNNYVAPAIQHALKSASRNILFGTTVLTNNLVGNADLILNGFFDFLVLTTDASAIDANKNLIVDQDVIGYATRKSTYAGLEANRGTINIAESNGNYTKQEYVFDFATDKANGTFRSLLFSQNSAANNTGVHIYSYFLKEQSQKAMSVSEWSNGAMCADATHIYIIKNNTIRRYNKTTYAFVNAIPMTGFPVSALGANDLDTDGSNIYFSLSGFIYKVALTGEYVNRFSLSSAFGVAVIGDNIYVTRTSDSTLYIVSATTMTQTGTRLLKRYGVGFFLTSPSFLSKSGSNLYLYDTNHQTFHTLDYSSPTDIVATPMARLVNQVNGIFMLNTTEAIFKTSTTINSNYTSFSSGGTTSYHYTKADLNSACNIGSRILLPSPVTKTNAQTMKITYTINLTD